MSEEQTPPTYPTYVPSGEPEKPDSKDAVSPRQDWQPPPSGWAQPPAPQSPGPPGAFVDRAAAPPSPPLPPGQGLPFQPGEPQSVEPAIPASVFNIGALVFAGLGIVVVIIVVIVLLLIFHH
jgi:hypothetical protein